ncbi:NADPH-dependent ferric siderophore reductase [Friedmanniella endophytica]|uniref:NADPH-dependent ferric siderophore reductase n=1 Tax=Microlunatus kandeliicorticis TaxID=1759536 RepID=A0A7W3ISJ6_9ACTN|nr:siderophore-interacting protein [Microlunatus kandeliicorticis]MBA8794449.1 NADPH-dependent ferric siderophore reductase [Microlunatus kandeliicorticis]
MAQTAAETRTPSRAAKREHVGMAMYDATVVRTTRLTPHLVRITLGDERLRDYRDDGPDARFKLLLPRPGQTAPMLPPEQDWYDHWRAMDPAVRPVMRTYTVRAVRPEVAELDIDVVLHEPAGPACRWAASAQPGDRVGVFAGWAEYEVEPGVRQLIAGDHTALPAVAGIGERLGENDRATIVVEVPGPEDVLALQVPAGVEVTWVFTRPGDPGAALHDALTALPADRVGDYVWVCAEQAAVARIRRHLVRDRGLSPDQVMWMGYWRTGGQIDLD